jgi:acetyl esterase
LSVVCFVPKRAMMRPCTEFLRGGGLDVTMMTLVYKTVGDARLRLNIWLPAHSGEGRPAVAVFYHGGRWFAGSPTQFQPQAQRLSGQGVLSVAVEYRTQGPIVASEDAVDAMNYIFEHASSLQADAGRIAAVGGSAGGQLALATAVLDLPNTNPAYRPSALISLNPVTDTTGEFPDGFGRRLFDTDEQALMYSPTHHVSVRTPPCMIMHGTDDKTVSIRDSTRFAGRVADCGGRAQLIPYEGQAHAFFNARADSENPYFDQTTQAMEQFLQSLGYLPDDRSMIEPNHS